MMEDSGDIVVEEKTLSFNDAARSIADFIEVATHTILYVRHIYPPNLFVRRQKYDTPVFQSRHPKLNAYINGAVKAVYEELLLGTVDKVVVVVKDDRDVALERFIFSVRNMIEVESFNKETGVEGGITSSNLRQYFRSFMVKLSMIESSLGQLELDGRLSFAVVLELEDGLVPTAASEKDVPPWMPALHQHTTAGQGDKARLHVVRAVDTGVINMSLVVQESEAKKQHLQTVQAAQEAKASAERVKVQAQVNPTPSSSAASGEAAALPTSPPEVASSSNS